MDFFLAVSLRAAASLRKATDVSVVSSPSLALAFFPRALPFFPRVLAFFPGMSPGGISPIISSTSSKKEGTISPSASSVNKSSAGVCPSTPIRLRKFVPSSSKNESTTSRGSAALMRGRTAGLIGMSAGIRPAFTTTLRLLASSCKSAKFSDMYSAANWLPFGCAGPNIIHKLELPLSP